MRRILNVFAAFVLAAAMVFAFTPTQGMAASKTVTVSTQAQLNRALKNASVKQIVISSKKAANLKIAKGNYASRTLSVNGAKLKVTNYGAFRSVAVKKAALYTEGAAKGNTLNVTAPKSVIQITSASVGAKVNVKADKSKISVKTNGKSTAVNVSKAASVSVTGKPKSTVSIYSTSAGAAITTNVSSTIRAVKSASIVTNAKSKVYVRPNAEIGSMVTNGTTTIHVAANAVVDEITSNTSTADKTKTTVNLGKNAVVKNLIINGNTGVTVKENAAVAVTVDTAEPVSITPVKASAGTGVTRADVTVTVARKDAAVTLGTAADVIAEKDAQITLTDEAAGSGLRIANGTAAKCENQTDGSAAVSTVSTYTNEKGETVRTEITADVPKGTATMDASADKVKMINETDSDIVVKITTTVTDSNGKSTVTIRTEVVKSGETVSIDPKETKEEEKSNEQTGGGGGISIPSSPGTGGGPVVPVVPSEPEPTPPTITSFVSENIGGVSCNVLNITTPVGDDSSYELSVDGGMDYKYTFDAKQFSDALSGNNLKEALDGLADVVSVSGNKVVQTVSGNENQYTLKGKTFTFDPLSGNGLLGQISTNYYGGTVVVNVTLSGNEINVMSTETSPLPAISPNAILMNVKSEKISVPEKISTLVNTLFGFDYRNIKIRK